MSWASFLAAPFNSPNYGSDIGNGAISAVIGIALVIVVLLIMIAILYAFRAVFAALEKVGKKKKVASEDEVNAAIVAAISEYRGDDQVNVEIKSIKKL